MIRTLHEDGTLHFSAFKKLSLSGVQYLHSVNTPFEPTSDMKIGSCTHFLLFGARPTAKRLAKWEGSRRAGKEWEAFAAKNADAEILTATEWEEAERIAESVMRWDRLRPRERQRLVNARFEVPLKWEEHGIPCSTDGIDILQAEGDLGDLKSTRSTNPEAFKRQCFNMLYAQQLAFYRRGAIANGIKVRDLFILGVENRAPYEVVELVLTEDLIAHADRSLTLWFEDLRRNMLACPEPTSIYDWPGYAEASVTWDVPPWMKAGETTPELVDEEAA